MKLVRNLDYYPKKTLNKAIISCSSANIACAKRKYRSLFVHTAARCSGLLSEEIMKKITLATIKSFIKKTPDLHISIQSHFDGMQDCVTSSIDKSFALAQRDAKFIENTMGIHGAWFVKGSRDYFSEYKDDKFFGYTVSNCCGTFVIAKPI